MPQCDHAVIMRTPQSHTNYKTDKKTKNKKPLCTPILPNPRFKIKQRHKDAHIKVVEFEQHSAPGQVTIIQLVSTRLGPDDNAPELHHSRAEWSRLVAPPGVRKPCITHTHAHTRTHTYTHRSGSLLSSWTLEATACSGHVIVGTRSTGTSTTGRGSARTSSPTCRPGTRWNSSGVPCVELHNIFPFILDVFFPFAPGGCSPTRAWS